MKLTNPFTEETSELAETPLTELASIFTLAEERFRQWAGLRVEGRVAALKLVSDRIEKRGEELAQSISVEMGKPIKLSRGEVKRTLDEFRYSLEHAAEWLGNESAPHGYVRFDPLGVIAVISPWNYPLMLPLRGIVPALLSGNGVIFKPSELSPHTAKLLMEIFERALSPCPILVVYGGKAHGAALVDLPVAGIAFTGSTAVGQRIAEASAKTLKRMVLELGGLDAAIVFEDADVEAAARSIVGFNTGNSGQVCNGVKRAIVAKSVCEKFVRAAVKAAETLLLGDPLSEQTELGPLVSQSQLERVTSFVEDAESKGAKILTGGKRPSIKGYFFEPTVLVDVPVTARLLHEEPFGPVLPILSFNTEEEALNLANSTNYGLTASLWTSDISKAERLAGLLNVGSVSINSHLPGGPGAPWGGTKLSGQGRAKTREGMREYTNTKFVRLP